MSQFHSSDGVPAIERMGGLQQKSSQYNSVVDIPQFIQELQNEVGKACGLEAVTLLSKIKRMLHRRRKRDGSSPRLL